MKIILNKILLLIVAATFLASCDKEELTVLNSNAETTVSLSSSDVVLDKDAAGQDVLTVSWTNPDFGFDAGANYKVVFTAGEKSETIAAGTNLTKVFETVQLNKVLLKLGLKGGTPTEISVQIEVVLSAYHSFSSNSASFTATAYEDKLDLSTIWGVVGSATVNGWDGPDMPFYTTSIADVFVAYVTLSTGHIKIRSNNSWTLNYGDTGLDGKLDEGGTDIPVTAGTYKITFNLSALTYTMEAYTWGIVGDATPIGWPEAGKPADAKLTYDSFSDTWKVIIKLSDGEIKFRQNNKWDLAYGYNGTAGILGETNIPVTAGNYIVTVDFNKLEYSLEQIDHIWGITGDATPIGWPAPVNPAPDQKLTIDFSTDGVWMLKGFTLKAGKIKFRADDSWDLNYGDTGLDGILNAGGDDIPVSAGKYDIKIDFNNPDAPTYSLTAL